MRTNGMRGQLFTWPPSSPQISCLLSFFKGNLFLDISKTHLKAIFKRWLPQSSPPASSLGASLTPPPVAPDVSQSPFFGSQHSFDLILSTICNPLQDTEARSPSRHTSLSHSLSAFLFPMLSLDPTSLSFFTISSQQNYLAPLSLCLPCGAVNTSHTCRDNGIAKHQTYCRYLLNRNREP